MEAAKIGPDSQVNYQEDPERRIILAPYVFCIRFTCKGKFDKFNYSSSLEYVFFLKQRTRYVCVRGRGGSCKGIWKTVRTSGKILGYASE